MASHAEELRTAAFEPFFVRALHDHDTNEPSGLWFRKADIIKVMDQNENG